MKAEDNRKRRILPLIVAAGLVLPGLFFSCDGADEPIRLRVTQREREMIDTVFLQKVEGLRARLDSICEANHDQWLAEAVDSILRIRKAEEVRLRQRAQRNTDDE